MSQKKCSRRRFLKENTIIGAGAIVSMSPAQSFYDKILQENKGVKKKIYISPCYFEGLEDFPSDTFGDLCLIRKGSRDMTLGSENTSIETIVTSDEWAVKADALRKILKLVLGTPPPGIDCDLSIRIEGETDRGDIFERRVSYLVSPGERVASLMLIPKGVTFPRPAMLTIQPTTLGYGKEITVGRGEKVDGKLTSKAYDRAYALHLAQKGYITFSPDILGDGERIFPGKGAFDNQPFIDAYPEWSGTGKDLWDLHRAIDVMQTFTEIDSSRIGSIGHSQGGVLTFYLSAVEDRVKVAVANCGVWPYNVKKNPFNLARTGWWTGFPALRPFMYAGKPLPIDAHEILALSAPRPFMNIQALNDWGFELEDEPLTRMIWKNLTYNVKKVYALYGAEHKFENIVHLEGHSFLEKQREQAYSFIDKFLLAPK